jgi:predicted PhzF superfamily epimerase YddE/YHI9
MTEVDLCGHATLAAAHALWTTGRVPSLQAIHFETKSGRLIANTHTHTHVHQHGEDGKGEENGDGGGWIWLDFPAEPASPVTQNKENRDWELVMEAFYCQDPQDIIFLGRNRMDLLVVLSPTAYHRVQVTTPNISKLSAINCRGIIATCVAGDKEKGVKEEQQKYDFLSRFFGPRVGINEDPVTGSAHCCLAPYWASVLEKTSLTGYQSSARAGVVKVKLEESISRVYLGGEAVLVKAGWLGF